MTQRRGFVRVVGDEDVRRAAHRAQSRMDPDDGARPDPDGSDAVAVRHAVATLPERQRTALVLRHVLELSAPETADRMGITPNAVRSLTKRATATLRSQLGDHMPTGTREVHDA